MSAPPSKYYKVGYAGAAQKAAQAYNKNHHTVPMNQNGIWNFYAPVGTGVHHYNITRTPVYR